MTMMWYGCRGGIGGRFRELSGSVTGGSQAARKPALGAYLEELPPLLEKVEVTDCRVSRRAWM